MPGETTAVAARSVAELRGREASCRPIAFLARALEREGHNPGDLLFAGIDHPPSRLLSLQERIDWDSFRAILARLETIWDEQRIVHAGYQLARSHWLWPYGLIGRLLYGCEELFRWSFEPGSGVMSQLVSCVDCAVQPRGRNGLELTVAMADGYPPSRELFLILQGALTAMPELLGYRPATVESVTVEGARASYRIRYPRVGGPVAWLRRWVSGPRMAKAAATELRDLTEQMISGSGRLAAASQERAQAELALVESEERFRKAFHSAPLLMIISTLDGRFVDVNESFCQATGVAREQLLGANTADFGFWQADQRDRALAVLKSGKALRGIEVPFQTGSGESRVALLSADLLTLGGQPCVIWQSVDITARKRAEEENARLQERILQTHKLEGLGVMAGGIAHDFNNLLVGILGNAELLLSSSAAAGGERADDRRRLKAILEASERAADLTRQMLAYAGKGRIEPTPIELGAALEQTAALVRTSVAQQVSIRCQRQGEVWIQGDSAQIRQVVMNLLLNAAEAYDEGAGEVTASCRIVTLSRADLADSYLEIGQGSGRYAMIQVVDAGRGMDASVQKRIFDPFFTTKFAGRGLGLAATLGVVRAHGGTLKVDSAPASGTTFEVYFPLVTAAGEPARVPSTSLPRFRGLALLVDDEAMVREVGDVLLQAMGFEVIAVEGGEEAIVEAERHPELAVVILDLTMPGLSGEETYRELRARRAELPILGCSGHGDHVGGKWLKDKTHAGFIGKPFLARSLAESLAALLDSQRR